MIEYPTTCPKCAGPVNQRKLQVIPCNEPGDTDSRFVPGDHYWMCVRGHYGVYQKASQKALDRATGPAESVFRVGGVKDVCGWARLFYGAARRKGAGRTTAALSATRSAFRHARSDALWFIARWRKPVVA